MKKYWCCKAEFGEHEDDCSNKKPTSSCMVDSVVMRELLPVTCAKCGCDYTPKNQYRVIPVARCPQCGELNDLIVVV